MASAGGADPVVVAAHSLDDVIARLGPLTTGETPVVGTNADLASHLQALALHLWTAGVVALDAQGSAAATAASLDAQAPPPSTGPTEQQWAALVRATESGSVPKNVFGPQN